ncbi:hypothetical protein EGT74_07840 [Chitinophaga lutea]|uniref:Phospholipid/glycerol acyltransferase domain-containing protein n=1 Tax=Chitinophaga lutea TaxID=2488634 RepID=A0A3N4QBQ2_9BACT|nr:hypothetical protein EGT74_07840 [Chitinophaga lutea]
MLYSLLKISVRVALQFYCKRIVFHYKENHEPCILACTHPNSFLDAMIMGALMPRSLHFLARGDAFKKPWVARILHAMHMIPIFRLSEGKENLVKNEETFHHSIEILRKNGCILIFPEGICVNEYNVRPLRKGTFRMAINAWKNEGLSSLHIQPVSIIYDSFDAVPKSIHVYFGEVMHESHHSKTFNDTLHQRLETGMQAGLQDMQPEKRNRWLLAIPAAIGWFTQRWFYVCWRNFARKKTKGTVFYDSVLFTCMYLTYPLLLLAVTGIAAAVFGAWAWWLLAILPFTAWCYKEYKSV